MVFQEFLRKLSLKQELRNQSREAQWQMERGTLHFYIYLCNLHFTSCAETKIHVHCRCTFHAEQLSWTKCSSDHHSPYNYLIRRGIVTIYCFTLYWILQCNFTTSATILMLTSQERNYFVHTSLGLHWILILLASSELNSVEYI